MRYLERAFSGRVIATAFGSAFVCWLALSLIWHGAWIWIMFFLAVLFYLPMVFNDSQMVRCDACRKRVKMGATTCHHCGYHR